MISRYLIHIENLSCGEESENRALIIHIKVKVKVRMYSPDIPIGSADFTLHRVFILVTCVRHWKIGVSPSSVFKE